jgi:hypothetical protein
MDADPVRVIWDHLQIQQVLARYCHAIDRCDEEQLKTVYWEDAVDNHGVFNGNAWEFAEFIIPMLQGMRCTMHKISNTLIQLDGDRAAVETYVDAYHLADGEDGKQYDIVVGGRYLDRFERRRGEWRIAERTFVHDWNQNPAATVQWGGPLYGKLDVLGKHDRTDLSYKLFAQR